ncbi:hypothetical protein [Brevundimonas sp.]|uniref:hypothetical protein n=1 Tax=Brevundimonas sp. TaxID=1871086 RepID=UPI002ABBE3A1|nr:hypothetical protein [Brevundimonas sp.]MDZ4363252.1 hypothetical protein [Brevundimonas sp.]
MTDTVTQTPFVPSDTSSQRREWTAPTVEIVAVGEAKNDVGLGPDGGSYFS